MRSKATPASAVVDTLTADGVRDQLAKLAQYDVVVQRARFLLLCAIIDQEPDLDVDDALAIELEAAKNRLRL